MIQFILNNDEIKTDLPAGLTLVDFIRYHKHLPGTKIGCREGDCGACTVLIGEWKEDRMNYSSATSCLMPIANARGKHVVTIEGINQGAGGLTMLQEAFAKEGATQCGFCTPGFIVSLTGYCINDENPCTEKAIDSMNGNICRCTGYKSIEKAAMNVCDQLKERNGADLLKYAVEHKIIPGYFTSIPAKLKKLAAVSNGSLVNNGLLKFIGGGTDLYVQQHDTIIDETLEFLSQRNSLKGIVQKGDTCELGAAVTVSEIATSPVFKAHFPGLDSFIKLVSSTQIRNMATLAGNFTNASPIGDLSIFFLALNTTLQLSDGNSSRQIPLNRFFLGYKKLDKTTEEIIEKISFRLPAANDRFNFEKVSKRTNLDIASVNTAIYLEMEGEVIRAAGLSAGGVGPVPAFLPGSSAFLAGKRVSVELLGELLVKVQKEISPISDVRGTEEYKRLLLSQLIKAHFIKLFPSLPARDILTDVLPGFLINENN